MTVAADIDQKPPMTTPRSARPTMSTAKFGAKATISARHQHQRRSAPAAASCGRCARVADEMNRLVSTAKMPETAIACPACPSVSCRSEAIGVSRLTGMNSDAIRVATQSVSAKTALQLPACEGRSDGVPVGLGRVDEGMVSICMAAR